MTKIHGSEIDVYKDGVLQIQGSDSSITSGGVALYGEAGSVAEFNDLLVRQYASTEPVATLGTTTTNPNTGVMTSPANGSTLSGSSVTFNWTAGSPGPYSYWMDIGSSAGGNNYYSSGNLGNVTTTATVYTLPTDGSTVYVTLYTLIGGVWTPNAYTYTAFNAAAARLEQSPRRPTARL